MPIEARNRNVADWFTRIRTRQTVLPRFQRFEAWDHSRVVQFLNTILRELPTGAALILDVGDEQPFVWRPIKGAPEQGERISEHLLDGQQRITALWRGLHNNYDDRTLFVCLKPDEETKHPYYVESIARWTKEKEEIRRPPWANKPKDQWQRRMIPLDLFCPVSDSGAKFIAWKMEAIADVNEREAVSQTVNDIKYQFASFNVPFLSLPVGTKPQTALDVFIRMNTSATPLSIYDIVVAQLEAGANVSLHDMVSEVRGVCSNLAAYYSLEDLTLYVGALLQGRPPTNSTYMSRQFTEHLLRNWDTFLVGTRRAVDFLEQERVFDAGFRLPTDVVVPVLVALWGLAPQRLDAEGRARVILRRYMWRAFFSNRYEKSTNTRAIADFNELKSLMLGGGGSLPSVLDETLHPLPEPQELLDAGWPVKKDRLGRAILALALRNGGVDLADGGVATRANLKKREYHHLFPAAHLERQKLADEVIYRSLNCALVTWHTNRSISDKEPERYLAERRTNKNGEEIATEQEVRARLNTHLIPFDEMMANDYQAFLKKRASLVHDEMVRLCAQGGT